MLCYVLFAMLCYVMYAMLYFVRYVMLCYVMLCYVTLRYVMLCFVEFIAGCSLRVRHRTTFTSLKTKMAWQKSNRKGLTMFVYSAIGFGGKKASHLKTEHKMLSKNKAAKVVFWKFFWSTPPLGSVKCNVMLNL